MRTAAEWPICGARAILGRNSRHVMTDARDKRPNEPAAPLGPTADDTERRQDAGQAARGLGRKMVGAVLAAAVVFAALALYGDVQALRRTASEFAPIAFAIGLLLAAGNYALRIVRWQYYLRHIGVRIPWGESSIVFLAGFVMSVTPGKVGEVFKSLLLYETRGTSIARTAPIVIAERLTDLIALVLLISAGALAFEHGVTVAVSSALLVAAVLVLCAYPPLGRFALRLLAYLPLLRRVSPKLGEAYEALLEMTRPLPLLVGSGLAFLAWGLECGSLYAIVHGFAGVTMSWDGATFTYAASTLAGAIAMMPGGLGVTEIGMTALLQALGGASMTPAVATAATMLVRVATLWFAVAIGLLALALHRALGPRVALHPDAEHVAPPNR
jgi:glycosyltransferase 2 family protein